MDIILMLIGVVCYSIGYGIGWLEGREIGAIQFKLNDDVKGEK